MVNEKNPNTWQDWETDDWDKSQPAGFESWDESPWQSPFEKPFASGEWENSGWDAVDPLLESKRLGQAQLGAVGLGSTGLGPASAVACALKLAAAGQRLAHLAKRLGPAGRP